MYHHHHLIVPDGLDAPSQDEEGRVDVARLLLAVAGVLRLADPLASGQIAEGEEGDAGQVRLGGVADTDNLVIVIIINIIIIIIIITIAVVSARTQYYQEAREGIYSGPTFLLSHLMARSAPIGQHCHNTDF